MREINIFSTLIKFAVFGLITLGFWQCEKRPAIDEVTMLDGRLVNDSSIQFPEAYLVSAAIPNPTPSDLVRPVIIVAHGYSASTFEWNEFREYAEANSNVLVSQVLLGGHGRSYEAFKNASWEDWQQPIIEEYQKLVEKGYSNISVAGSSTGCPLTLEFISSNKIVGLPAPKNVFLIDPIIIPSSKLLSLVKIVGPILGYIESGLDPEEQGYWYNYRPQESLQQLEELIVLVRKRLETGIVLTMDTRLKVYKAKKDGSADPVGAVLLYKGIKTSDNQFIDIEMIDSDLHVFTRLRGRPTYTNEDIQRQQDVFADIIWRLAN